MKKDGYIDLRKIHKISYKHIICILDHLKVPSILTINTIISRDPKLPYIPLTKETPQIIYIPSHNIKGNFIMSFLTNVPILKLIVSPTNLLAFQLPSKGRNCSFKPKSVPFQTQTVLLHFSLLAIHTKRISIAISPSRKQNDSLLLPTTILSIHQDSFSCMKKNPMPFSIPFAIPILVF